MSVRDAYSLRSDCGKCNNCKDKKKFGDLGRKKQACAHRKCVVLCRKSM